MREIASSAVLHAARRTARRAARGPASRKVRGPARRPARRFLALLLVLCASSAALADEILQIFPDSLTSYLAPATNVQDIRPRHSQRGVNIA